MTVFWQRRDGLKFLLALVSVVGITAGFRLALHLTNSTTAALTYLLVVLITAAIARLWVAILTSVVADLCLNYFFMPPFGTLTIADPQNRVALFVFFAVSVIASKLSAVARERERESTARRDELVGLGSSPQPFAKGVRLTRTSARRRGRAAGSSSFTD